MAGNGDIMDQFDDDELRRSIESAETGGQWRDPEQKFVDPKLQALARQLAELPRANYTERRLQELDRRAAQKAASTKATANSDYAPTPAAAKLDAAPANWRETIVRRRTEAEQQLSPELVQPTFQPRQGSTLAWIRNLGAAVLVFGAAAAVQATIAGVSQELGVRAALAAVAAGCAWQQLGSGRFRAAAIGGAAHGIAFVGTGGASTAPAMFAAFLGTLVVLLGSGAVGMMLEEKSAAPRKPAD